MPTSSGIGKAILNGEKIGCNTLQLFTHNPRQWKGKEVTDKLIEEIKKAKEETGIEHIVSHDTYLINLCAKNPETHEKSVNALTDELHRCSKLGIQYVISHMGAHLGQGEEEGLSIVAKSTKNILADIPDNVFLCMETTAGQGTCLNYKFEHLARIIELCQCHPQLVVCLDTCHIFSAGYDISNEENYEKTFQDFESIIGIDKLKVIHCNDSMKPFGSRLDRHEHLGEGSIGLKGFELLVNDDRFNNIPIILETPDPENMHEVNLKKLKSLLKTSIS